MGDSTQMSDAWKIDKPRGWERTGPRRLDGPGRRMIYHADGDYEVCIEATECRDDEIVDEDDPETWVEYIVGRFERVTSGDDLTTYDMYLDKGQALERAEELMWEVQETMLADTELHPDGEREVTGIKYNGGLLCPPCARDAFTDDEVDEYIQKPEGAKHGSPVFIRSVRESEQHCDDCGRVVETEIRRYPE